MKYSLRRFRFPELDVLEENIGLYRGDLAVYSRPGSQGETFALAYDQNGRKFPEWILYDAPLGYIREYVELARKISLVTGPISLEELRRQVEAFRSEVMMIVNLAIFESSVPKNTEGEAFARWKSHLCVH